MTTETDLNELLSMYATYKDIVETGITTRGVSIEEKAELLKSVNEALSTALKPFIGKDKVVIIDAH
jgi:hypothetical protein